MEAIEASTLDGLLTDDHAFRESLRELDGRFRDFGAEVKTAETGVISAIVCLRLLTFERSALKQSLKLRKPSPPLSQTVNDSLQMTLYSQKTSRI
jgi:hypothetical protein